MILALVIAILVLAVFGMPLFAVIAGGTFIALTAGQEENFWQVIIRVISINSSPELTTIPLFTIAGYLMARSGTPRRLVNLANAALGWLPGGLAIVALVVCSFFTAFTGASGVTIVALGVLLLPVLMKEGYPERFSIGLVTASGNMGMLFPPSLPIIVYGIVSGARIDDLFLAGLVPGLLLVSMMAIYAMAIGATSDIPRQPFRVASFWKAIRGAAWEIPLPVVVLGGIYGGFFAPLQAAAVTASYCFIIEVVIYRDIHPIRELPRIMRESMTLIGAFLVIVCAASGFTDYLIDEQIPDQIFAYLRPYIHSQVMFLLVLNGFLLIVGCMMDIFSATFVVVPLILPFARMYNIDPVHLGIVFLTNLGIGYTTPPFGMNLFIASFTFRQPMVKLYRAALPFLGIMAAHLILVTYVPSVTLWLPGIGKPPAADTRSGDDVDNGPGLDDLGATDGNAPSDDEGGLEKGLDDDEGGLDALERELEGESEEDSLDALERELEGDIEEGSLDALERELEAETKAKPDRSKRPAPPKEDEDSMDALERELNE